MDLTSHNWQRARRVLVWWSSGTASSPRVAIGIALTPPGLDHRTWWGVDLHLTVQLPDLELRQCRGRHGQLVPQQLAADRERRAVARAVQPPGRRIQGQPATQMRADPRYRPQRTTGASYKPDDRAQVKTLHPALGQIRTDTHRAPLTGARDQRLLPASPALGRTTADHRVIQHGTGRRGRHRD